VEELKRCTN